jgi:hypothetical protein
MAAAKKERVRVARLKALDNRSQAEAKFVADADRLAATRLEQQAKRRKANSGGSVSTSSTSATASSDATNGADPALFPSANAPSSIPTEISSVPPGVTSVLPWDPVLD